MTNKKFTQKIEIQAVSKEGDFSASLVSLGKKNRNKSVWSKDVELMSDQVLISSYDHDVLGDFFSKSEKPVGAGILQRTKSKITVEGKYNLNTAAGVEAHANMKFMFDNDFRQDWSIGGYILEYTQEKDKDGYYEVFHKVMPVEASPVILGADTGAKLMKVQSLGAGTKENKQNIIWIPELLRGI